jgi:hypothetical protein
MAAWRRGRAEGYIITYSNELKQMKRNLNRIYNNCHGFNGLFSTTGAEGYIITYSNKYIIEFIIFIIYL